MTTLIRTKKVIQNEIGQPKGTGDYSKGTIQFLTTINWTLNKCQMIYYKHFYFIYIFYCVLTILK